MVTLVTYASRHGATREIARHIAKILSASGHEAVLRRAGEAGDVSRFDAFVIGSAAYMGSWLKEAVEFVAAHQAYLATRPVWLFSSGPLRVRAGDDALVTQMPHQFAAYKETIRPRDMRVFAGALETRELGISERLLRSKETARRLLPEGDFRDWLAIDAWAERIARELAAEAAVSRAG